MGPPVGNRHLKSKWTDEQKFVKKHTLEIDRVLALTAERRLELRDLAVLYALEGYCSWMSGRIEVTAKKIAERLKMQEKHVISSLTRLKKERLLAKATDPNTGMWFYLISPDLLTVGTSQREGYLRKTFSEALDCG